MIKLCQRHFEELVNRWGGEDAIDDAYEGHEVVEPSKCEHLDCIKERGQYVSEY